VPTEYGKRNPPAGVVAMLEDAKSRSVSMTRAAKMSPEELEGKIVTGILHDDPNAPEFQARTLLSRHGHKRRRLLERPAAASGACSARAAGRLRPSG